MCYFLTAGQLLLSGCSLAPTPNPDQTVHTNGEIPDRYNVTLAGPDYEITKLSRDIFWIRGDSIRDARVRSGLRFINERCKILSISDLGSNKSVNYGGSWHTTIVTVVEDGKCISEIEPWK